MNAIQWLGNKDVLRFEIAMAVQVSLVLGATLCASWLCRRRTAARHAVCLCGLCAALACPLTTVAARHAEVAWLTIPLPAAEGPVPATAAAELPTAPAIDAETPHSANTGDATPSPPHIGFAVAAELEYGHSDRVVEQRLTAPDLRSTHASPTSANVAIQPGVLATALVVMVWFIGVVYFLLRWVRIGMQLRRIVRDARSIIPASGGRQPAEWAGNPSFTPLFPQLGIAQLSASRSLPVPIVYGILRPRIIIPESLLRPGAEDLLRDVLLHELSHVRRRDPFVHLLQRLATVLYWPHPLVYILDRQLSATREDLCDNHVLQHRRPADYARTLLQLTEEIPTGAWPQAAVAMLPQWCSLEQRVAALLNPRRSTGVRNSRWLNGLIAAGAVCVGLAAAGIHAQNTVPVAVSVQADNSNAVAGNTGPDPTQRLISGIVVDESGQPVAGATVRFALQAYSRSAAHTNARGNFELLVPPVPYKDEWELLASDSVGTRLGCVEVLNEEGIELRTEVALAPSRTVTVNVRDAQGNAIPGALVTVVGNYLPVGESLTDERGLALVKYPQQVEVAWVIARKDGVGFDYFENYAATGQQHFGPLAQEVQLTLDGARSVTCRVVDSSGQEIRGAFVYPMAFKIPGKIWHAAVSGVVAVTVNNSGQADFGWLPTRFEQGIAFHPYHAAYRYVDQDVIRPDDGVDEVVLRMHKLASITGRVTDLDGRPAPGIRVIASGIGAARIGGVPETRSAADGTYRLAVSPDAAYMVSVNDPDFAAVPQSTNLIEEGASVNDVHLTLIRGTLVTGRITAGSDHAPVKGASVGMKLTGEPLPNIVGRDVPTRQLFFLAKSNDKGRYAIRVPPGQYDLTIYGGQPGGPHDVRVPEQAAGAIVVDHHFDTAANRPLRGQVVRAADGVPLPKATVYLGLVGMNEHATSIRAITDDDGHFTIDRTGPRHLVYAASADNALAGFTVSGVDTMEIKLKLSPAATAVGQLVDHTGQPLAGVEVAGEIRAPNVISQTARLTTRTDADGRYRIPGVAVGSRFYLLPQRTHFGRNSSVVIEASGDVEIETIRVPRPTDAADTEWIADSRERLVIEIDDAASESERSNLLRRALAWAEELLADRDRDPTVHENAVLLLTDLNARSADPDRKIPAVPFTAAYKPLLRILSDPKFAADTRAAAAEGLTRILNDSDDTVDGGGLSEESRRQIQEAMAAAEKESIRPGTPPAAERRKPD